MTTAEKLSTSGICVELREIQCVCKMGGEGLPTTIFDKVELAREPIEIKHKNEALSNRNTDMKAKLLESLAARSTMWGQITVAENLI